jgi:hypothetical protein
VKPSGALNTHRSLMPGWSRDARTQSAQEAEWHAGTARAESLLRELAPLVFNKLQGCFGGVTGRFLCDWASRPTYLSALARGDARRDLNGHPAGEPTHSERQFALVRLGRASRAKASTWVASQAMPQRADSRRRITPTLSVSAMQPSAPPTTRRWHECARCPDRGHVLQEPRRGDKDRGTVHPALALAVTAPSKNKLPWLKLARFGDKRTDENCLRHDENMLAITGIEADYDGGAMTVDEACELLIKQGLAAVVYTSPSHSVDAPRWRVLCPLSQEVPPARRNHQIGRLNGLFRGIFANESWTLSQSYYFGSVGGNPAHRVEVIEGKPIDDHDDLDAIWLGKPNGSKVAADADQHVSRETREDC